MLDVAVVALSGESVEVGPCGQTGGIPEVLIRRDVLLVVDAGTPLVVDVKSIDGIAHTLNKIEDDKAVVDTVAIRSDNIGELEEVIDNKYGVGSGVGAVDHVA